jgi:gamma-D-glutamyl-L-lysine dipeptidyl-peptidase
MKAACIVSAAPIRKEAAHRSEMTSQLLFGETAEILETEKNFTRIKCDYDGYEGYIQTFQITEVDAMIDIDGYTTSHSSSLLFNNYSSQLSLASPVFKNKELSIGKHSVQHELKGEMLAFTEENIKQFSSKYVNTPYLWGGRSSFGIDCSGFCQQVFKVMGIRLDRDAYQQAAQGEMIGFLQEAKCGDLAFFDNEEGKITHVGILLSADEIIHAAGRVRIDTIDSQGIINSDNGQRTHNLRTIRRFSI